MSKDMAEVAVVIVITLAGLALIRMNSPKPDPEYEAAKKRLDESYRACAKTQTTLNEAALARLDSLSKISK